MLPTTIDEVIIALEEIIKKTKSDHNPMGYFAALYCRVTRKVKEGIATGIFEDGPRMARLDVIFANRYLDAYYLYRQNKKATSCWEFTFKNATQYRFIVLQHLLLGMNAHINLDLSIAAAQTCPGVEINSLKNDFNKINEILGSLVRKVEAELFQIWPSFKYLLRMAGNSDLFFANISMSMAREEAWNFAKELAALNHEQQIICIAKRDLLVTQKAQMVVNPGFRLRLACMLVRHYEKGTVAEKIDMLNK